jgi:hypothetical protein
MSRLLVIGCFFLSSILFASEQWQEPEGFRAVKWGASIMELQSILGITSTANPYGERIKTYIKARETLGPAEVRYDYGFLDDKFASVRINLASRDFDHIRSIFVTRYGEPHTRSEEKVQTRGGAVFMNEILRWKGPTIKIELRKFSGTVTEGSGTIAKNEFEDELVREMRKSRKDAAKNL